jgi:phosphatidylethanolamine-binding protein (PEBP) family uncharacterized protein
MRKGILAFILLVLATSLPGASAATPKSLSFQAEIWVDNWFALYVNGKKVGEDSVAFNTEKSFNSSKIAFTSTYPFEVGVLARDYIENSSGLEYIGKPNQQIGDAGFIMQIRESKSGRVVASTNSRWKSFVIQKAPINTDCVTASNPLTSCQSSTQKVPSGWSAKTFKDGGWKSSSEFTEPEVGVKEGYFNFSWDPSARLIWSSDLKLDNTVLFRSLISAPSASISSISKSALSLSSPDFTSGGAMPIDYTCDGAGHAPALQWRGVSAATKSLVLIMNTVPGPPRPGEEAATSHAYLVLFNISPTITQNTYLKLAGTVGINFKDKNPGYTPPCSQGPGMKSYTFTLYALSSQLSISPTLATENSVTSALAQYLIEKTTLTATYERK